MQIASAYPEIAVHIEDNPECRRTCKGLLASSDRLLAGGYITDRAFQQKREIAYLPLHDYTFESYAAGVRKMYKGNAIREARKAGELGYFCQAFNRRQWIPDIYEINTSLPQRSGRPMAPNYLLSVTELGGPPKRSYPVPMPTCRHHVQTHFGVFRPHPGYKQGDVVTDCQLVGYITVNKYGDFGIYSMILGHGDYLKDFIMSLLHLAVIEHLLKPEVVGFTGLNHLMYHRFFVSNPGLTFWKKKFLFRPAYWVRAESS